MKKITIHALQTLKEQGEKFAVVTAYDASFAALLSAAEVEVILVGDSLGMVIQGHDSTLPVSVADVAYHTAAVKQGAHQSLIIADMPFTSYRNSDLALENAGVLMQAGAHMVKLEGGAWLAETFQRLGQHGIPACAHLGLTPQSVNKLGGYRVQGRNQSDAQAIMEDAIALEQAGADLLVLECVPSTLAAQISKALTIPVIGIGAGKHTDAQVLVIYDMLGITAGRIPKFAKNFLLENDDILSALQAFVHEVKAGKFPTAEHSFK